MTQGLARANLNSSRLIRFLTDLSVASVAASEQQFAERLGQLLSFSDAIRLSAVQNAGSSHAFEAGSVSKNELEEAFLLARSHLVNSIVKSCSPSVGFSRIKLPTFETNEAIVYERFLRFYSAHQREIDARSRNLRSSIRDSISAVSPQLQQLATLDAALDEILNDRARKLFASIPKLLEKRFDQLLKAHQQTLAKTQQDDNPASWIQAGGWLERFCGELQGVLLAELDVRLQPALGLVEAFIKEVNGKK